MSVLKAIDARRRAFFWAAEETCTGAQCLVAWDKLCVPTSRGGLGVKYLNAQNVCRLLKFQIHAFRKPALETVDHIPITKPTHSLKPLISKQNHYQTPSHAHTNYYLLSSKWKISFLLA
jgi:hypothetical protein